MVPSLMFIRTDPFRLVQSTLNMFRFFSFFFIVSRIFSIVSALPQNPNDLNIDTEQSLPIEVAVDNGNSISLSDLNNSNVARCSSSASSDNLTKENTENSQMDIFRRQATFCPSGILAPPKPNLPQTLGKPSQNPSENTRTEVRKNPCPEIRPKHVTCAGPEVRDSDTGSIDIVVSCEEGKLSYHQSRLDIINFMIASRTTCQVGSITSFCISN